VEPDDARADAGGDHLAARGGPGAAGRPDPAGRAAPTRSGRRRVVARTVALLLAAVLVVAGLVTADDLRTNGAITVLHSAVENATDTGEVAALKAAAAGGTVRLADVASAIAFVHGQSDGSDFRLVTLLRLLAGYPGRLDPVATAALRGMLDDVRWWMDEPGVNPMVYWSENHQILFAADELLAGQLFPADQFRDGRTGVKHAADARDRIEWWLAQRWQYGFSEWDSHYYAEDVAALCNLVDFAADPTIRANATAVLDLLLLDVASHTGGGEFIATSGRLYGPNRMAGDAAIRRIVAHAFSGADEVAASDGIDIGFQLSGYRTPAVLAAIAGDTGGTVVTETFGRNVADVASDPSLTTDEHRVMALWGMEAFTNPEAVDASFDWIRAHGLLANPYLAGFRQLDYRVLRAVGALPVLSRLLDLPTNGTALERADTYAFRAPGLLMSTTQDYRPGGYGNQEAIFQATLGPGLTLFHNHPAVGPDDPSPNGNSPGYWTGDGTLPVSCQTGPVNLSLYALPPSPGFGRSAVLDFTHLHAPLDQVDESALEGNRLFLRSGSVLIAVTAGGPLRSAAPNELVQDGRLTWWVTEASSTARETLAAFEARVRSADVSFDGTTLAYTAGGQTLTASATGGCTVGGRPVPTPYTRLPAPYAVMRPDGREATIEFAGQSLAVEFTPPAGQP
jgi:hypothetical protein